MALIKCPECEKEISEKADICVNCGKDELLIDESKTEVVDKPKKEFHGIYRYSLFGGKQEVYCPRCGSENCSYYTEQKYTPAKTKTRYTANPNPLHPFTLVNKMEKVIRKESVTNVKKIMFNDCGYTF